MPSASLQPSVIDHYLLNELEKGCIPGPYSISPLPSLHVSRFGAIPKKDQPGKWRLILDLSRPLGNSFTYGKVCRGKCIPNVLIHSDDCYLLGAKWRGNYFIDYFFPLDYAMPRSSSLLLQICWNGFSNIITVWIFSYSTWMTSTVWVPPNSPVCQNNLDICIQLFEDWGIPVHPDKLDGPST